MWIKLTRALVKLGLTFAVIPSTVLAAQPGLHAVGDRVLFEIDSLAFSQREMEVYLGVRSILKDQRVVVVSERNWEASLESFTIDMMINHEARRSERFTPSPAAAEALAKQVKDKIGQVKDLAEFSNRLGLDRLTLLDTIADSLRVDNFKASKEKAKQVDSTRNADWLSLLEKKSVLRYFAGYRSYTPLARFFD